VSSVYRQSIVKNVKCHKSLCKKVSNSVKFRHFNEGKGWIQYFFCEKDLTFYNSVNFVNCNAILYLYMQPFTFVCTEYRDLIGLPYTCTVVHNLISLYKLDQCLL